MALILAINPGGSQSATLARLARELQGDELIGADSCTVALKAIDQRPPDLVLLPATEARGETELLARLDAVPGGVPVVRLPPPMSMDVRAFATDLRELLTGPEPVPPPAATSPHLIAAATAAVEWIRARRAIWADAAHVEAATGIRAAPPPVAPMPRAPAPSEAEPAFPPRREFETEPEPAAHSVFSRAADTASEWREAAIDWLPRVAALAIVAALVAAGVLYWPDIQARLSGTLDTSGTRGQTSGTTEPASEPAVSELPPSDEVLGHGWIAVFAPFEVAVSEGSTPVLLDERGRAMLPPGSHRLRFQNRALGYDEVRTVRIRSTETTTLNLVPQTTITVTSNEPAEVIINGSVVGQTPLVDHSIRLGLHTVIVRTGGAAREFTIEATSKPVQLDVDF